MSVTPAVQRSRAPLLTLSGALGVYRLSRALGVVGDVIASTSDHLSTDHATAGGNETVSGLPSWSVDHGAPVFGRRHRTGDTDVSGCYGVSPVPGVWPTSDFVPGTSNPIATTSSNLIATGNETSSVASLCYNPYSRQQQSEYTTSVYPLHSLPRHTAVPPTQPHLPPPQPHLSPTYHPLHAQTHIHPSPPPPHHSTLPHHHHSPPPPHHSPLQPTRHSLTQQPYNSIQPPRVTCRPPLPPPPLPHHRLKASEILMQSVQWSIDLPYFSSLQVTSCS